MAIIADDTTTIKRTDNYRNDIATYKLNSEFFEDTTAQRFLFYFFCRLTFFKNNYSQPHKWHIWFYPNTRIQGFATPKEPLFSHRAVINDISYLKYQVYPDNYAIKYNSSKQKDKILNYLSYH